jgi:hypothetical protein
MRTERETGKLEWQTSANLAYSRGPGFTTKFSGVSSNVRIAEIADIGCMIKLFLCRRERWAAAPH